MGSHALNIIEVIENLTTLVDAQSLEEIEVTPDDRLLPHKEELAREIYWVPAGPDDQTLSAIKHTFRSVRQYLQHSFDKIKEGQDPKRFIEGMGTIMVLVGEAAQKLDKLGLVFKEKLSEIPEYKDLQEFYKNVVLKGAFHRYAKEIALKEKRERVEKAQIEEELEERTGVHLLNNIDLIKGDYLYELFYLKNEEGHHFYTRDLARNIKLSCDFGEFAKEYSGDDPLLQIKNWEDKNLQLFCTKILEEAKHKIRIFYKEAMLYRTLPLVILVNNALMALMLGSNRRNLIRQFSLKGSHLYFSDFQHFLREILQSREYQKELIYPSKEAFYTNIVELVRMLCYSLFIFNKDAGEVKEALTLLTHIESLKKDTPFSEIMKRSFQHLQEVFAKHPNGPLFKALDLIRDEELPTFDPLMQSNLSEVEAHLKENGHEITLLRLACPTMQEVISKAHIVDEFKEYLRATLYKHKGYHHLIVNFQDKTSWKEHARAVALEEFAKQAEFSDLVTVITLSKDSNFYHQNGEYENLSGAEEFISQFIQHLTEEEGTGYYFPKEMRKVLFPQFIQVLCKQIHKSFFKGQDILSQQDRKNFIELAYAFIEWKVMEESECSTMSLTSKDGLDISATASVALLMLLQLSKKKSWEPEEVKQLIYVLFGQTLMVRERAIHSERFTRLLSLVELLERSGDYLAGFKSLFKRKVEVAE